MNVVYELKALQQRKIAETRTQKQIAQELEKYQGYKIDMANEGALPNEIINEIYEEEEK